MQRGATVFEAHLGGTSPATLHDVRSVTKSIASLAVGVAIADGKIPSEKALAFPFLADLRPFAHDGPLKAGITIEDLLTMSSALDCDDDDARSPGNEENMYPLPSWSRFAVDLPTRAGYARDSRGRGPFAYCTAGAFLLGRIVVSATGEPADRYVERKIFAPLGMGQVLWNRSPSGEVALSGQLRIQTSDLVRLGTMVLHHGEWEGRQIVPAAWIERALTPQVAPNRKVDPQGILRYGYLFWGRDYGTACGATPGWYMSGNGGNHVVMLKALDAVAVVTTTNFNTRGMHAQTTRLLEEEVFPKLTCAPAPR